MWPAFELQGRHSCTCGPPARVPSQAERAQVWLALLASVIFTTVAYHMLNYSSPFGEFDTMRLRRSTQAPDEVKTYVVQSRAPRSAAPGGPRGLNNA